VIQCLPATGFEVAGGRDRQPPPTTVYGHTLDTPQPKQVGAPGSSFRSVWMPSHYACPVRKSRSWRFFRIRAGRVGCFAKHPGQHAFWRNCPTLAVCSRRGRGCKRRVFCQRIASLAKPSGLAKPSATGHLVWAVRLRVCRGAVQSISGRPVFTVAARKSRCARGRLEFALPSLSLRATIKRDTPGPLFEKGSDPFSNPHESGDSKGSDPFSNRAPTRRSRS
jgi:hypothetical protein